MRNFFGWSFGLSAIFLVLLLSHELVRGGGRLHLLRVVFLTPLAFVFAKAWWSTWKDEGGARIWGIAASLVLVFAPLFVVHLRHRPFTRSEWEVLVWSGFALVSYAWPDRETDSSPTTPKEEHNFDGG
jgi:hypothetical protein